MATSQSVKIDGDLLGASVVGLFVGRAVGPVVGDADGVTLGAIVMGDLVGEIVGAGGGEAVQSYPRPSPRSGRGPPK